MEIQFVEANASDIGVIVEFSRDLFREHPAYVHTLVDGRPETVERPFEEETTRRALEVLLGQPSLGQVWIVRSLEGRPIGYLALTYSASLEYGGVTAFVDELFVTAPCRGQGVGTAALQFAEQSCRARGVRALHLEVERDNEGAERLYRRMGFEDYDRRLMTKRL